MKVVIQCGGKGTRLRPYTMVLPKPLMPVRSQPVLELLMKWLRRNDVRDVYITTGYLGHIIKSFCGDGRQWDMRITYTEEAEPLGTIGPLSMLRDELDSTFMVINGDVLTDLNIGAFADCHRRSGAMVTVAMAKRKTLMDFGVLEVERTAASRASGRSRACTNLSAWECTAWSRRSSTTSRRRPVRLRRPRPLPARYGTSTSTPTSTTACGSTSVVSTTSKPRRT